MILSRQVLTEAEEYYRRTGDELEGFLSEETGFLPRRPPERSLPESHKAWDEIAAALPALWRDLGVRAAVRELPALRGTEDVLPARYVRRASTILSFLAHSYVYSERDPYGDLPVELEQAWDDVGRRLGKPEPFLRYEDIVLGNWCKLDEAASLTVENLEFLVHSVGIQTERNFYLTQVEVHARASSLVGSVVRAQEAIARGDQEATEEELLLMIEVLRALTDEVLIKLDPNAYSPTAVDPVLFGVIVADLAVPFRPQHPGPSGTAAPLFHVLDAFLGRTAFESEIGADAVRLRTWGPKVVERFVTAIAQGPGAAAITATGSRRLRGLLQTLVDLYSGPRGWLESHRLKVYGFIEMSFKAGRPVTIGGFAGEFHDRPWRTVHRALDESRAERELGAQIHSAKGLLTERRPAAGAGVQHVVLDVRDEGVVYRPGDRCQILPANSAEHVARTLRALRAAGDEPVALTAWWRLALRRRSEADTREELPLEEFLTYAKLRPVSRGVAKELVRVSSSPSLHAIVESRREDEFELWEALELIAADGYDVAELWRSTEASRESLAAIVPPETFRLYSISSVGAEGTADEIELMVEAVAYESEDGREPRLRRGTASHYLTETAPLGGAVPIAIVRPPRFLPPADDRIPMVVFAEDLGIAPLRGILRARASAAEPGPAWLFFQAATRDGGPSRDELQQLGDPGWFSVEVALSDESDTVEQLIASDANAALIRSLIQPAEQGGRDAQVYVSGRDVFVQAVTGALREVGSPELIRRLAAERRLMFQVLPTHRPRHGRGALAKEYDTSELVLHNDAEHGYWIALEGDVCDMSEFRHLHPGGSYIVDASAGIDASQEYATVLHHRDTEINAMLAMYKLGAIRRLQLDGALHELFSSWVRYLFLITEMQNAFENDLVCLDAQTTALEAPAELTPLKLMLFSKTNDRFVELYYRGLSASPVCELWRASAALCDPPEEGAWMERELVRMGESHSHDLERVRAELRNLWERSRGRPGDEVFWSAARAAVTELSNCDRRFISSMKAAVREGVQVFERYERGTAGQADALLDALRKVPEVVERYHRDLAGVSLSADGD